MNFTFTEQLVEVSTSLLTQVHSGIHKSSRQPVALKFISKDNKTPEDIAAIKREIKLHRRPESPSHCQAVGCFRNRQGLLSCLRTCQR